MPNKKNSLLENLQDLCRVPSPSLHERGVAKVLAKKIRALGYEPLEDDAGQTLGGDCGNIIVKVPGSGKGPRLLLSAHMDTVEKPGGSPAKPKVDGDWVSRDGGGILGADDKAGVAVLLEVLSRLASAGKKHGDLVFAFTVAEEIGCLGAAELDPEIYRSLDAGVILDTCAVHEITTAAPTKVTFRITVHGITGHAAFPERKINAAYVMAQTLARLPMGRLDEFSTANLGIMHSGAAVNVIPGAAYAEYEMRSHRKDVLDFHVKRVIGSIEGVVRENRVFTRAGAAAGIDGGAEEGAADDRIHIHCAQVDVDVEVDCEGYALPDESRFVAKMRTAIARAGLEPVTVRAQGASDANILNKRGLESVVLGCGMYGVHGDGERANLQDMANCADAVMNLVTDAKASMRRKAE